MITFFYLFSTVPAMSSCPQNRRFSHYLTRYSILSSSLQFFLSKHQNICLIEVRHLPIASRFVVGLYTPIFRCSLFPSSSSILSANLRRLLNSRPSPFSAVFLISPLFFLRLLQILYIRPQCFLRRYEPVGRNAAETPLLLVYIVFIASPLRSNWKMLRLLLTLSLHLIFLDYLIILFIFIHFIFVVRVYI